MFQRINSIYFIFEAWWYEQSVEVSQAGSIPFILMFCFSSTATQKVGQNSRIAPAYSPNTLI